MTGLVSVTSILSVVSADPSTDGLEDFGSLSTRTHVLLLVATAVCVVAILRLVRRHGLRSKYSLLWLTLAVLLLALGVFPGLLVAASRVVGIHYPPAAFLTLAVAALLMIVIHFSWELSRLEERTRILSEHAALLGAEIDRLRNVAEGAVAPDPRAPDVRTPEMRAPEMRATERRQQPEPEGESPRDRDGSAAESP